MTKWEYSGKMLFLNNTKHLYEQLNELGQEGWEVVHIDRYEPEKAFVQIKRAIEDVKNAPFIMPDRVVINHDGEAVGPTLEEAMQLYMHGTIFIRKDGWSIGSLSAHVDVAEALWHDEWAAVIKRKNIISYERYKELKVTQP